MTRKYPILDIKILYLKSAGYCSMSDCRLHLAQDVGTREKTKQIGIIAHIRAHSSGGPRADPEYPQYKIDTYDNWILLCPTCHSTVDTWPNNYSVEDLLKIKVAHESWVSGCLNQGMTEFSFAELDVVFRTWTRLTLCFRID